MTAARRHAGGFVRAAWGLLCLAALAAAGAAPAQAFTAVAVSMSGGFGSCHDQTSEAAATACALQDCRARASDPPTCRPAFADVRQASYALATGLGHRGVGRDVNAGGADRRALQLCGAPDCTVRARWQETLGEPDLPTLPPLAIADPAHAAILIVLAGSVPEEMPDRCHLGETGGADGLSPALAGLDGITIDGLTLRLDPFCTPHRLGTVDAIKVDLRTEDLVQRLAAYRAAGVPARHILVFGHSAGGWAALQAEAAHPELLNAVIAAAPAFAGEAAGRDASWQGRRDAALGRLVAAPRLDAMVFAFAGDPFEPASALAPLAKLAGVRFVAVTGADVVAAHCLSPAHFIPLDDCFAGWSGTIRAFLAERLR